MIFSFMSSRSNSGSNIVLLSWIFFKCSAICCYTLRKVYPCWNIGDFYSEHSFRRSLMRMILSPEQSFDLIKQHNGCKISSLQWGPSRAPWNSLPCESIYTSGTPLWGNFDDSSLWPSFIGSSNSLGHSFKKLSFVFPGFSK